MLSTAMLLGGVLLIAGMATYWLAPRVGPNPIFGVRIGYAYASREIWDRTNRAGGVLFMVVGIGVAILGLLLQLLNVAPRDGIGVMTGAMLVALLGGTAWLFVYARGLAQGTAMARELVPVRFRWAYIAPVSVTFAALVWLALSVHPQLPADRVATHFNFNEQPDGWQSRDEFIVLFLGLAALFVILDLVAVFVATREPMIAFGRWGKTWRIDPERGLIFTGMAMALANLIFIVVLWDVAAFNIAGAHLFPLSWLFWMIFPLIAILIGLFFFLARREV